MTHQLWDLVRPRTESPNSVWRVIEIDTDKLTAELRPNELQPRELPRCTASHDFFISLEVLRTKLSSQTEKE